MHPFRNLALVSFVTLGVAAAQQAPGWSGDPAVWRDLRGDDADGLSVTGSSKGVALKANTFLIRDGALADFELRCLVRLDGANNSGIQYRSRVLDADAFRVVGYQCDIHPNAAYAGMLYHEGGAGIVAQRGRVVRWTDDGVEVLGEIARQTPVDFSVPHALRIVARGDLIWHELDGHPVMALQDLRSDAPKEGVVALQVHRGPEMQVDFTDLTVRALDAAAAREVAVPPAVAAVLRRAAQRAPTSDGPTPQWIWDGEAGADEELFLRRSFRLDAVPERARLAVSADNNCRVYVNGARVAKDDSWESPTVVDVARDLQVGENVVAVHAWNDGGPAGVAVRLSWKDGDESRVLVSDPTWRCGPNDPEGYDAPGFDDSGWAAATAYGLLGAAGGTWSGTLDSAALGVDVDEFAPQVAVPALDVARAAPRARVDDDPAALPELLLDVPRSLGSWVTLCFDDRGRLYTCDQRSAGLFRIEPAAGLGEVSTITPMPAELSGAHGLLWWRDALYAVCGNGKTGFYRVTDSDGDDLLDRVELLRELDGSGEHGPHSVAVAPDGEHLLVLCGNMTKLTELAGSRVPTNWAEDRLVPRINDANGFWGGYSPPGGCLYQVTPDGDEWELLCCGFRNPFDLAVLPNGKVIVYDADMEWDMGLPWYRPTRWLLAQDGVDYGWRKGSAKWPDDYPDAPAALVDIGPGSPTGMALLDSGEAGVLGLDWTFGTVYLDGEPWLAGAPFPVADVAVDPRDPRRAVVVTGGRGLPSKVYRLPAPADGARLPWRMLDATWGEKQAWPARETRSPQQILDAAAASAPGTRAARSAWVAARIALERLPVDVLRPAALAVDASRPDRSFAGLLALARQGSADDLQPVLDALAAFDWAQLDHLQRIAWLRVHALALLRLGPADDAQRALVATRLTPLFPAGDERQDQDLCELLAFVDAPGLLDRAVPLLVPMRPSPSPRWAELAQRNARYGGVIDSMIESMPPMGQISIAHALTMVDDGWTIPQRRAFVEFVMAARERSGGSSYDGFLIRILDRAWDTFDDAERRELEFLVGRARAPKRPFSFKPPKGPGQDWQLDDIPALVTGLDDRKEGDGRNLYWAAGCASCHYFRGEGGFGGPDLTSLKNKMRPQDVLESILAPSKVISDQYSGKVLTKTDGQALFGVVHKTFHGDMEVYEVVEARPDAKPLRIPVEQVRSVEPSPVSPMPKDLLDRLSADEVRDLLAFLLSDA